MPPKYRSTVPFASDDVHSNGVAYVISKESVLPVPEIEATKGFRASTTSDPESPRREKGPESF